jgi:ankyrin repeat protein
MAVDAGDVGEENGRERSTSANGKKRLGSTVIRPAAGDQALLDDVLELRNLYGSNHLSDIVFVFPTDGSGVTSNEQSQAEFVTASSADQKLLPAHRLVLSLRSGAFQSALLRSKSSQVPGQVRFPIKIVVEDTSFQVFSTLVRYLYRNEIVLDVLDDVDTSRNKREERDVFWRDLLRAAFVYLVPSLVDICAAELTQIVSSKQRTESDGIANEPRTDRIDLRHLRKVLDTLVFCDAVLETKPNATHRRSSTRPSELGSAIENRGAGLSNGNGHSLSESNSTRGFERCFAGVSQLQQLCMDLLEDVPDGQFESLLKSDSGKRCSTERLCEMLKRRSTAPLVVAIRYQIGRVVNELLRMGEALDKSNDIEKDLPLVAALKTGNDYIIRRLLVDADAPFFLLTDKIPLVFLACTSGNLLHCQILIEHNPQDANLISPLEDGDKEILADFGRRQTPLHVASKKGHAQIVELLLKNKAASNLPDEEGNTPLHRAANVETAAALLSSAFRTNADIPNRRGQTALHVAAANGNVGVVNLLIHHGADQDVLDDQGQSAFHVAAANGHTSVALILLHENEEREQSMKQRARKKSEAAEKVAPKSSSTDATDEDDMSPRARPISDINREDYKGNTALHLAAMSPSERCQKMLQLLLENGADPNRSNWFGYTPLHLFCSHHSGPASIVDVFVSNRPSVGEPMLC